MQQSSTGGPCANTRGHSNAALFVQGHILAPTGSTVTFGVGKEMEKPRKKILGGAHKANQAESLAYDPAPPTQVGQLLLWQALYHCNLWSIFYPLWLEV